MNMHHYILDDKGNPVIVPNLITWACWMQTDSKKVAITEVEGGWVSTVFLGLDHNWNDGPPILWETLVFGGVLDQEMNRCAGSLEQAEAMHLRMVERVNKEESLINAMVDIVEKQINDLEKGEE